MVPHRLVIDGRRVRFAVSDNDDAEGPDGAGDPPLWAVNLHGYFAGGGMYWRESSQLAAKLGWRVVNPSLPGFAGSDPLPWEQVNIREIAAQVVALLDRLSVPKAVLLGHSMGGAVAMQVAADHPERTLGIVYRDGAATPAWRNRHGVVSRLLGALLPDVASVADLMVAAVLDIPDLLIGRRLSTVRGLWPDARRNIRSVGRTLPVGAMLMSIDMRAEVTDVVEHGIPLLAVWGCFDRICNPETAAEFTRLTGAPLQWVPGGHSWMLPRPQGQADVLRVLPRGRQFLDQVARRHRQLFTPGGATSGAADPEDQALAAIRIVK